MELDVYTASWASLKDEVLALRREVFKLTQDLERSKGMQNVLRRDIKERDESIETSKSTILYEFTKIVLAEASKNMFEASADDIACEVAAIVHRSFALLYLETGES